MPYWLLIPRWLARADGRRRRMAPVQKTLADVLTAQYCLFLSIRIHDDILDDQHEARPLVFVADRLSLSARERFARHFPPTSAFWRLYDEAVRTTVDAIADVLILHRARETSPVRLLRAYARVSRVLTLAAVAVCLRRRRPHVIAKILRSMDELAIASQILDDLHDMREDLRAGRSNYVTVLALRNPILAQSGAQATLAIVLAETELILRVLADARRRFRRAFAMLRSLGIGEADGLSRTYDLWLTGMEESVRRQGRRNAKAAAQTSPGRA